MMAICTIWPCFPVTARGRNYTRITFALSNDKAKTTTISTVVIHPEIVGKKRNLLLTDQHQVAFKVVSIVKAVISTAAPGQPQERHTVIPANSLAFS